MCIRGIQGFSWYMVYGVIETHQSKTETKNSRWQCVETFGVEEWHKRLVVGFDLN